MDAILFGVKRAHMAFEHRLAAKMLAPWGLTPARFDLLRTLSRNGARSQASMRRMLGVAGSTLSRMLRSLERLAIVERDALRRGRRRHVTLTERGRFVFRHAAKKARRVVRRRVDAAFCVLPKTTFEDRETLEFFCGAIRTRLGDSGNVDYPWHPDD